MKHICLLILGCIFGTGLSLAQINKPLKPVPEAGRVVALTFDDGIEPGIHKEMLKEKPCDFVYVLKIERR